MKKKVKVGVVIGRFQVPSLHPGHLHLLSSVLDVSDRLLVIIGLKIGFDERNCLPFDVVMDMIAQAFPEAEFGSVFDDPSDEVWSEDVDRMISLSSYPDEEMTLYGSRDCFKEHYRGKYPVEFIPELLGHSGTDVRERIDYTFSLDFRKGIFYAFQHLNK